MESIEIRTFTHTNARYWLSVEGVIERDAMKRMSTDSAIALSSFESNVLDERCSAHTHFTGAYET